MEIRKATRQGVKPLISFYSESGCGKTYSSLLFARGFVGPDGKMCVIDTESGRASLYADIIPGGYDVLPMEEPFSPSRYIEAIQIAERSGAKIIIIDSASHEWENLGGVLDMASQNEARSGKPGLHNWRTPKLEHQKFVLKLLQSTVTVICCLRAKYKSRQTKDTHGKTQIVKDEMTSPIQADDFLFESTCHAEILPDHSIKLTKWSHPALRECFPKDGPITSKHGELLASWCANAGGSKPATQAVSPSGGNLVKLKKELFDITRAAHNGDLKALEQFLIDEIFIPDDTRLADLTSEELQNAINKYKTKFK